MVFGLYVFGTWGWTHCTAVSEYTMISRLPARSELHYIKVKFTKYINLLDYFFSSLYYDQPVQFLIYASTILFCCYI